MICLATSYDTTSFMELDRVVVYWLVLIFFAIGLFFSMRWYLKRRYLRKLKMRPINLFFDFAKELGLSKLQCQRLVSIANKVEITNPLTLLLSPRTLDVFTALYLAQLSKRKVSVVEVEIKNIRRVLFD